MIGFIIILLLMNLLVIIMQQIKINELYDDLQHAREDAINELNKLRNGENKND